MANRSQNFLRKKKKYAPIHMNLIHASQLRLQAKKAELRKAQEQAQNETKPE